MELGILELCTLRSLVNEALVKEQRLVDQGIHLGRALKRLTILKEKIVNELEHHS